MSLSKRLFAALLLSAAVISPAAAAETILGALSKAYQNNSALNAARAGVRVTDEGVAIAKSGYRPRLEGVASATASSTRQNDRTTRLTSASYGIQLNQMLFDGFQTKNNVAAAESQVRASQQNLRNTEENTLFNAAEAYMDVIRDRQIAALRQRNLEFLDEQVRAARSRLDVGEGTRTDVAQVQAQRAAGLAQLSAARAQELASEAAYIQIVGDKPGQLKSAAPLVKLIPKSIDSAFAIASSNHPAILAYEHLVDAAGFSVKSAEGALLPQLSASAGVSRSFRDSSPFASATDGASSSASIGATLTVPIYEGGRSSALVRQSKETLGQQRIQVDVIRDQVRQQVASAWTQYEAARQSVDANRTAVSAAQLALNGVIEERNVGTRTTLDVLLAQNDVITAQINLATSEHDVVVASYAILVSTGNLSVDKLGLKVAKYDPREHYNAVKDKWYGLRTPDGR